MAQDLFSRILLATDRHARFQQLAQAGSGASRLQIRIHMDTIIASASERVAKVPHLRIIREYRIGSNPLSVAALATVGGKVLVKPLA